MSESDSARARAEQYISHPRFHQSFTLPATADHETLNFSYADVGSVPTQDHSPPAILFMPGMFASRYLAVTLHAIAEKLGVRVLVVDRPGMGSSTNVPIEQRVPVWIELVPRLLAHLKIDHVSLASHSAGTIYLLNTLFQCRDVLNPERPFAALLAPWVDVSHSHVTSMQVAQYIPNQAFSIWHHIPRMFVLNAGPALASSGAVVGKLSNALSLGSGSTDTQNEQEKNRKKIEENYGLSKDIQVELESLTFKAMFGEDTVGANSEAMQCLKKKPGGTWGVCEDYQEYVQQLVSLEERRHGSAESGKEQATLKVRAYFSESDAMIGSKGQAYMEKCWTQKAEGDLRGVLDFESVTVSGVDHDSLVQSVDTLERVFVCAGGSLI